MAHHNNFVSFLRHYGPIPASDNMYDELIQSEMERYEIEPPIHINPERLNEVRENFESDAPRNVILTGTAGDGKTYYCRQIFEHFDGDPARWKSGEKTVSLTLPASGKTITIVKDLSELTQKEKYDTIEKLAMAVEEKTDNDVFLVAANDGQLVASWRDWSDTQDGSAHRVFRIVEDMLVKNRKADDRLCLNLYNLSMIDASKHFEELVQQILEHPQWAQCQGCELLEEDGTSTCPIRINRSRLSGGTESSIFRDRLGELIMLARANRMHLPIRDLLLLCVNILLGDQQTQRILLTCRTARNRANNGHYRLTNPYANVFGMNLPERQRQQYQVFATLEAFGIGRETDNKFDSLLIYGEYRDSTEHKDLVSSDRYYGASAYQQYQRAYLSGEHGNLEEFLRTLAGQRQRLFFSLPSEAPFDPWCLTVYQASGMYLEFVSGLEDGSDVSKIAQQLVQGLNRTFCGMMIDEERRLFLASSGGDGRGRIASLLKYRLGTRPHSRDVYLQFKLDENEDVPMMQVIDPQDEKHQVVDSLSLQLTHFEYLVRVARGSLPASFSRQCHEDFLDFKLRLIKRLDERIADQPQPGEINLQVLTVDERGQAGTDDVQIRIPY